MRSRALSGSHATVSVNLTYWPSVSERALPQPALMPRFGGVGSMGQATPASLPHRPLRPEKPRWVGLCVQPPLATAASSATAGISDRSAKLRHEPRDDARIIGIAEGVLVDPEQLQERHEELVVRHAVAESRRQAAQVVEVATGRELPAAASRQHHRHVEVGVLAALTQLVAPVEEHVVE